jgi:hypothetical protein
VKKPLRTKWRAVLMFAAVHTAQAQPVFFDDFAHADLPALAVHGWTVRSARGHPGISGAQWGAGSVALVPQVEGASNPVLRLRAATNGSPEGTQQAQVCHQRKYFEGTYAARVRFSDTPVRGADGDVVVQSFYLVSPLKHDFDPNFSEVDWEYLPNGGWGDARTRLYGISWQTVRLEPWQAHNQAHEEFRSMDGWHTLVLQVMHGKTRHILDGIELAVHGGRTYPVVPMSLNFNHWFSPGGILEVSKESRIYEQDVDWVFHAKNRLLSPAEVNAEVARFRVEKTLFIDSIPSENPVLPSTCDF